MSQFVLAFSVIWAICVAALVIRQVLSAIEDIKTGVAQPIPFTPIGLKGRFERNGQPVEFMLVVGAKFLSIPLGVVMIWFAADIFWR